MSTLVILTDPLPKALAARLASLGRVTECHACAPTLDGACKRLGC